MIHGKAIGNGIFGTWLEARGILGYSLRAGYASHVTSFEWFEKSLRIILGRPLAAPTVTEFLILLNERDNKIPSVSFRGFPCVQCYPFPRNPVTRDCHIFPDTAPYFPTFHKVFAPARRSHHSYYKFQS